MSLPERRPPTHIVTIEIPVHLTDGACSMGFDAFQDAIKMVISVSRAAYVGAICETPNVTVEEA